MDLLHGGRLGGPLRGEVLEALVEGREVEVLGSGRHGVLDRIAQMLWWDELGGGGEEADHDDVLDDGATK